MTGLTSNPTIFGHAIKNTEFYNDAIRQKGQEEKSFCDGTDRDDGWVSLEMSPLLAYISARSIKEATELYARAKRPNLIINIPDTPGGLPAIEETIISRATFSRRVKL